MRQYYKASKKVGTEIVIDYWYGDSDKSSFLFHSYDFVLALGTKKPRNVPKDTIKLF